MRHQDVYLVVYVRHDVRMTRHADRAAVCGITYANSTADGSMLTPSEEASDTNAAALGSHLEQSAAASSCEAGKNIETENVMQEADGKQLHSDTSDTDDTSSSGTTNESSTSSATSSSTSSTKSSQSQG